MPHTHILAVRLDDTGDVLLTGPAIRALRAGAGRVTLLCGPEGMRAARLLPGVDAVRVFEAPWVRGDAGGVRGDEIDALMRDLRGMGVDEALIFTSCGQSPLPAALLLRMAGIGRVGAISRDHAGSLLDVRHRVSDDLHEVDRAVSLAKAFGYPLPPADGGRLAVNRPASTVPPFDEPYVVVHPGTSVAARAWPAALHRELVRQLADRGTPVAITGAPRERQLTRTVAGGPSDFVADLGGMATLAQMADVFAGARAVVVGNTGAAHLAAAAGTPVVSLFAPTVPPIRWRPYKVPQRLLMAEVPCAGCRARPAEADHSCMAELSPAQVLSALDALLAETADRVAWRPLAGQPAEQGRPLLQPAR